MLITELELPIEAMELRRILQKYGVLGASVFGSFARGEATSESDLDLLVTYAPQTSLFKVIDLQDELQAATGRHVDLVSAKFIRPRLATRIKSDLVSLY
jgi:predicted nucleotidyltransferase